MTGATDFKSKAEELRQQTESNGRTATGPQSSQQDQTSGSIVSEEHKEKTRQGIEEIEDKYNKDADPQDSALTPQSSSTRQHLQINYFYLPNELKSKWAKELKRHRGRAATVVSLFGKHANTWQRPEVKKRSSWRRGVSPNEFLVKGVEFSPTCVDDVEVVEEMKHVATNSGVPLNRVLASFLTHALSH